VAEVRGLSFPLEAGSGWLPQFATNVDAPADFSVDVSCGDLPGSALRSSGVRAVRVDRSQRTIWLDMNELVARLRLADRHVDARLGGSWVYSLETLLKNAAQIFGLELRKALYLHASSVDRAGLAYVFLGRSEAGKSTAALISREAGLARVLREEMTAVGDLSRAEPVRVFTLPSVEEHGLSAGPAAVPLRGLYWLQQDSVDSVNRISVPEQVRRLAMATSICVRDEMLMIPALELAEQLVRRVPVRVLRFRKSAEFWKAIDEDLVSDA